MFDNNLNIITEFDSLNVEQLNQKYHELKIQWKNQPSDIIPNIPIQEDGSIRIAGCAGTKKLCQVLEVLITQLNTHDFITKPISRVVVGRHGLSTKTYGNEWNGRSKLFQTGDISSIPDYGHNVKIYGERGQEKRYFDLLDILSSILSRANVPFNHFTTNSFFTDKDGTGVPGSRLTCLRFDGLNYFLDYYGDNNSPCKRGEKPRSFPIELSSQFQDLVRSLCFTRGATFMHDLKLVWTISNFEKLEQYFTTTECCLYSGGDVNGSNDMLFHKFSELDLIGYRKAITPEMLTGQVPFPPTLEIIEAKLAGIGKSKSTIYENFVAKYRHSFHLSMLFHQDFNEGILNLKVSAMVTDPGPSHIKKAYDGYFPLGPQDGDDIMALYAILGIGEAKGVFKYPEPDTVDQQMINNCYGC